VVGDEANMSAVVTSRIDRSGAGLPSGLAWWIRSYTLALRFDFANQRAWLPITIVLQVLLGAGMAMIYGFYVPHLPKVALLYLVTGAPTLSLIPAGLVLLPALIGMQKTAGTFDFLWSLPIPRPVGIASTLTITSLIAIPGIITTLLLAAWRYDVQLAISWTVLPAFLLSSLMCASVGLGMAHAIKNPVVTNLITNVLVFVVLLFSPISFPKSQFPMWLADVHEVLPLYHMGVVIRASLTTGLVSEVWVSYAVLGAWTVAGWAVTAWVVGRRG
jgi:ABC-2 type transport system permease protein